MNLKSGRLIGWVFSVEQLQQPLVLPRSSCIVRIYVINYHFLRVLLHTLNSLLWCYCVVYQWYPSSQFLGFSCVYVLASALHSRLFALVVLWRWSHVATNSRVLSDGLWLVAQRGHTKAVLLPGGGLGTRPPCLKCLTPLTNIDKQIQGGRF